MNIAVIGTGYVGLVAGSCLAESGNDVWCVDSDAAKIENLRQGMIPIYEPGLPEIVERNLREERLTFTTDLDAAVKKSFVLFVAVGTPTTPNGAADLAAVFDVARAIGKAMDRYKVIVVKSTVPAGTSEKLREILKSETHHPFDLLSNPEFLKQGAAVDDFMKPDRVVVGADDVRALADTGRQHNYEMKILEAVGAVNDNQAQRFVEKIRRHFSSHLSGARLAVWGLSFKPRTNDMRDAPAIKIIESLLSEHATITAYDPEALDEAKRIFGTRIQLASNNYGCVEGADALLLITEWQAFRNPNFERMKHIMRQPVIFDGRNIYDPGQVRQLGFTYYSMGRT